MNQIIKIVGGIIAANWLFLGAGGCLALGASGCTLTTRNNAEWMLTYGGQIGVRSTASDTNADASVNTEFPALEEWIKKSEPAGDGDGNGGGDTGGG